MMKGKTATLGGVVLGLVAILLASYYLSSREKAIEKAGKETEVLVAAQDIPERIIITERMLTTKKVPAKYLQPTAITSKKEAVGKVTIAPIKAGGQITGTSLVFLSKETGLAVKVPTGKVAVIIPVENVDITDLIKPGDYVDVLATFRLAGNDYATATLLQNIEVLAVGKDLGAVLPKKEKGKGLFEGATLGTLNVSLALTPMEAQYLTLMKSRGKIDLVLRSLGDDERYVLPPVTFSSLFSGK